MQFLKTRVNYHLTSRLEEVIHLRERVKSLEYLDEYHRDQLHQKDLLVQELMGTVNRLEYDPIISFGLGLRLEP